MNKTELVSELAKDRKIARFRIHMRVCEQVARSARGGWLPSCEGMIDAIMSETAKLIREFPALPAQFWAAVLQDDEINASSPCVDTILEIISADEPQQEESAKPAQPTAELSEKAVEIPA